MLLSDDGDAILVIFNHLRSCCAFAAHNYALCPLYRINASFLKCKRSSKTNRNFARVSTREWRIHYKSYFKAPFLRYSTFEESAFRRSIRASKNLRCIKRWEDCQYCRGENEEFPHHNSVQPLHVLDCADYSAVNFRNNVYVTLLNLWDGLLKTKRKATQKKTALFYRISAICPLDQLQTNVYLAP